MLSPASEQKKARSMYEGKERIKERVGEERVLFQAPVSSAASNQTYSPVLCYKTECRINEKLIKGCLMDSPLEHPT